MYRLLLFLFAPLMILIGALSLPAALLLSIGSDYMQTVNHNWDLDLPLEDTCLYSTDDGLSFNGDGLRLHILSYGADSGLEAALTRQTAKLTPPSGPALEILDSLDVPESQRPGPTECLWFTSPHPSDSRNRLYLVLDASGTRLYVIESFF